MFGTKRALTASFCLVILLSCMPSYAESRYTAEEFLTQPAASKSGYIQVSLMTANFIANQNDAKQGKCIGDWYDSNRTGTEEYILGIMAKNKNHHPLAIIMALAEKQCGEFSYKGD